MFVEYEEAVAAVPLNTKESSTPPEKRKPGRPIGARKERNHQINQRERERMKEISR